MRIREFLSDNDFESIKDWITDERTHYMWCAGRTSFPIQKESFDKLLSDILINSGDLPFVAVDDNGTVEGFFCYSLNKDTHEGFLKFIMVDPAKRGVGLGKKMLIQAVLNAFDNSDAEAVQLMVFSVKKKKKKCYEGVGFKVRSKEENAIRYNDETWTRYNMVITRNDILPNGKSL